MTTRLYVCTKPFWHRGGFVPSGRIVSEHDPLYKGREVLFRPIEAEDSPAEAPARRKEETAVNDRTRTVHAAPQEPRKPGRPRQYKN